MKYLRTAISIIILLIIWLLWSNSVNNSLTAPSISQTLNALKEIIVNKSSYIAFLGTITRFLLALLISTGLGVTFGFLSGLFSKFEHYIHPIVTILRTIPTVAIIIIIWMMVGANKSPLIITFLILFPISYQAILDGIKELHQNEYMEVYRLDSKLSFIIIYRVYFPLIINYIKLALVQTVGLGIKVLVMAEFTAGTKKSIGTEIRTAQTMLEYDTIFAWTIILIILVVGIEVLLDKVKKSILDKN